MGTARLVSRNPLKRWHHLASLVLTMALLALERYGELAMDMQEGVYFGGMNGLWD